MVCMASCFAQPQLSSATDVLYKGTDVQLSTSVVLCPGASTPDANRTLAILLYNRSAQFTLQLSVPHMMQRAFAAVAVAYDGV